jgi:hypothetical protein
MLDRTHLMAPLGAVLVFCALASKGDANNALEPEGMKAAQAPKIELAQRLEPRGGGGRGGAERSAPGGARSFNRGPSVQRGFRGESRSFERRGVEAGRAGQRGRRSLWRGGDNDRRVERGARDRRIERGGDRRRAIGRGDLRGRWDRGRVRRHGRHFIWGSGIDFWFYDGYYYGDCNWLRRRAVVTGSRYWWRRYRLCRYTSW